MALQSGISRPTPGNAAAFYKSQGASPLVNNIPASLAAAQRNPGTAPAPAAAPAPAGWSLGRAFGKASAAIKGASPSFHGTPSSPYGSESGPGILGQWFNQRANGTDPGWEYAMGRASDQINNQYAARGGYNSSGAMQSLGDMYANATSQREGQLDTLAAGASTEHQNQLNNMFTQGLGIANGESNAESPYGVASGTAQGDSLAAQQQLILGKSGVDQKKAAAEMSAISSGAPLVSSIAGKFIGGIGGG